MSDHEFGGHNHSLTEKIAQLEERVSGNDRRYQERWTSDQKAIADALAAAKEQLGTLVEERDKALKLQYTEYERRLNDLNHAHERAVERNNDFVANDVYIADKNAQDDKTQLNTDAIAELRQLIAVGSPALAALQSRADIGLGQSQEAALSEAKAVAEITAAKARAIAWATVAATVFVAVCGGIAKLLGA